jgi:hypothetical protein
VKPARKAGFFQEKLIAIGANTRNSPVNVDHSAQGSWGKKLEKWAKARQRIVKIR